MTSPSPSELKAQANALMTAPHATTQDLERAVMLFSQALATIPTTTTPELHQALLNNKALALFRLKQFSECEATCSTCLNAYPGNAKALYRRAKARIELDRLMDAAIDGKTLFALHPQSPAATELLQTLNQVVRTAESGARKLLSDALKPGQSPDTLKQLLAAVNDDENRAMEAASRGGTMALFRHALDKDPLAWNVLARMAAVVGCQRSVADALASDPVLKSRVELAVLSPDLEESRAVGALLVLMRAALANDRLQIKQDLNPTVFIKCLSSSRIQLREVAIEACAQLFGSSLQRTKSFCEAGGIEALDVVANTEPQLVSVVLGRVLSRLAEKGKDNDEMILKHVRGLVHGAFEETEVQIDANFIERRRAGLNSLLSVFTANADMGVEVICSTDKGKLLLLDAALQAPDSTVSVAAEILAQMASTEKGRGVLSEPEFTDALHKLVDHSNSGVRAAASVALTKIEAVHFDCATEQGMMVLSSLASLLAKSATPEEVKRGLEAVSFVISDTDVKMMMTTGEEGTRIIKALCTAAREKADTLSGDSSYALAFILANITMDEDDKKREKLREMEVSQEQWEKFEEMTKQKSRPGNSRKDSPEEVATRVDACVTAGAIPALRTLIMKHATLNVATQCAKALANMAREARLRGAMISQGAISALLKAYDICNTAEAREKEVKKNVGIRDATHALARLFITTDPRLLPEAQIMDAIDPLLQQVRVCDEELVVFESLMALTNLESVGNNAPKIKVCASKGLTILEYAMFSENNLVRRAATECMSNLVGCDEMSDWLARGDKVRLWILFVEDWERDWECSRAAAGCLAMVAEDPRIARALRRFGAVDRFADVVRECPHAQVTYRVVYAMVGLARAQDVDEETALQDEKNHPGGAVVDVTTTTTAQWKSETGKWSDRETNVVKGVFEELCVLRNEEEEFAQAVGLAKSWLAGG